MNKLDLLVKTYSKLHNYKGIPYWVLTPYRRLVRSIANCQLPKYLSNGNRGTAKKQTDIIVSFTSFPARIDNVWLVVECMLRQVYQPKKIILWLSKEQFSSKDDLPKSLLERENSIFEIRFVDEDIRSHKKYYYVSKEYPDSLILLIDDDLYYPTDMIEDMCTAYVDHPMHVICRYGFKIKYDNNANIQSYKQWKSINREYQCSDFFFGSGGGVLFTPSYLYQDLTNQELFLHLAPIADDIWLNAMVRLAKLNCFKIKFGQTLLPIKSEGSKLTLCSVNVGQNKNDEQIEKVSAYYMTKCGINPFALK